MSLNLLNFHKPFLAKKVLFICLWNFRFCSFSGRISLFSLTMSKLQALWEFLTHNAFAANFFIVKQATHRPHHSCNQAKYQQDAPRQKLSILLLKPRHFTICRHIGSFDKISIKSSKKSDLFATLVKFNQALNPHSSRQQKFVKTNALYTRHKMLQTSVNLLAYQ